MDSRKSEYIRKLVDILKNLEEGQLALIEDVATQLAAPYISIERKEDSDLVDDCLLYTLGDFIRVHHGFSHGPFTKDKFEYALEQCSILCGASAGLARQGNPGWDITINNVRFSLKTQANASINAQYVHISKFMELGKGHWSDSVEDLVGLREQFLHHMESYQRILSLRCLSKTTARWHYQLVEIPRELLLEARDGCLRIQKGSKQSPKPGYCDIQDERGKIKFQLYFDGGGERKLQIKNLRIQYCIVHATWEFSGRDRSEGQLSLNL